MLQIESPARGNVANTLGLPCMAAARLRAAGPGAVGDACRWAREQGLPLLVLGEGSNVVLPERLDAAVLTMRNDDTEIITEDDERLVLRAGAGRDWHELVLECVARGQHGLENLALIPGSVGAAPVQNIGAYGVELAAFVEAVHGVDTASGELRSLSNAECGFRYRDSVFKGELDGRFIITAVDLALSRRSTPDVRYPALRSQLREQGLEASARNVCDAVISLRRSRLPDPRLEPNAGSFFKNPEVSPERAADVADRFPDLPRYPGSGGRCKLPAAWLIERCGLKGVQRGVVGVSSRHALVLVNRGGAVQRDVLALAREIRESVAESFGVALEIEPRVYRSDGFCEGANPAHTPALTR